jgi:hypothetical protein
MSAVEIFGGSELLVYDQKSKPVFCLAFESISNEILYAECSQYAQSILDGNTCRTLWTKGASCLSCLRGHGLIVLPAK